ncbi:hypothetical protein BTVI_88452 [Pitangus sulphuratus]|nr:hypothetical protein BTVI_88452 [Pitangus sulphuratus]
MKKHHHHSVQGTFSRLFGKRHSSPSATSLFATNPPWIFTQEVTSDSAGGTGDVIEVYYGDNRFGTVTDSGTATLKPRPRVRPLLTFLPLNAQESHGVAVPTPSVPEDFEEKAALGSGSQINGNYRMYSSMGDLRPQALEGDDLDEDIPPPPSSPAPQPGTAVFQYKVHRAGASSAEPPCAPGSAEPPGPGSSTRSPPGTSGAGQEEVLIHPVTGERVERGSPMALLLAARQRAQRGRQGGDVGSALRAKPPLKLSSASSDTTSTSFFRHESKPYSFTVVPRPAAVGSAGSGWSKPPSFSSSSDQGRDVRAAGEAQPPGLPGHRRAAASSLLRGLLDSGQPNQPIPSRHAVPREEENGETALDYGIIPPPPEFSNEADEGALPSREESRKCPSFPDCSRGTEEPRYFRWPGYGGRYGGNHEAPAPLPSEKSRRNGDLTPQFPDYSSSSGYSGHGPNPRPLIKKRLYVSEPDSSYPRAAAAPRATGTLSSYGPGGFSSVGGEGSRRLGPALRNGPTGVQGRRPSVDAAGKAAVYGNAGADAKYKGQNGDFSPASVLAASRPAHGSPQYGGPTNTFTVRPGTRQPISYAYQSSHR